MKATDAYRFINESPLKGIILFYSDSILSQLKYVKLSSVISSIQTGKTPPKSQSKYYESEDIDWFKPSDIGHGKYLESAKEKFAAIALKEKKGTLYPKDTLLMIGIGGGVGRVSILKQEGSSNQQITGLSFKDDVYPEWVYYYYLVREDYVKSQAKSMSFPILNQEKIGELDFKYPSKQEQIDFCSFLDHVWDSYENGELPKLDSFNIPDKLKSYTLKQFRLIQLNYGIKKSLKSQKSLLSQLKQSILQEAIQGKLTAEWRAQRQADGIETEPASELLKRIQSEKARLIKERKIKKEKPVPPITDSEKPFELPEGWEWCSLDEISFFKNGKAHEQHVDVNGAYILINSKFVSTNGSVKKFTGELMMPMFKDEIAIVMSDVPDGRALSRCFLIEEENKYSLNQRIGGITSINGISPKYLVLVLDRNPYYLTFNDGKKQTNLMKKEVLGCPIPLPPLEEQKAIVEKVESLMEKCRALDEEINLSEQHAQMLMQAVLKEAFEG